MPEAPDYEFMQTQYELLRSRMMAERVASALKLGEDADFFRPRKFSIFGAVKGNVSDKPRSQRQRCRHASTGAAAGSYSRECRRCSQSPARAWLTLAILTLSQRGLSGR